MNKLIDARTDMLLVVDNKQVESNCISIGFRNQGTTNVIINDSLVLVPGDKTFSINQDEGYIDRTLYNIKFDGAGTKSLLVVRVNVNLEC